MHGAVWWGCVYVRGHIIILLSWALLPHPTHPPPVELDFLVGVLDLAVDLLARLLGQALHTPLALLHLVPQPQQGGVEGRLHCHLQGGKRGREK
jgi:hypothetical protein